MIVSRDADPDVRLGDVDGLRGLGIVAVVVYEAIRLAPPLPFPNPLLARAAIDAGQGLSLFLLLSGFSLAHPLLLELRRSGRARFDLGAYLVKRILRIYPAYLVALALTFAVPLAAARYGLQALAGGDRPDLATVARNLVFAGDGLGNDGFRALALFAGWYLIFPFALVLWIRAPAAFAAVAAAAVALDLATPAHGFGAGALAPLMLGIVAAELRAHRHPLQHLAPLVALGAAAAAFAFEPRLAGFPGPASDPWALRVDPLWALALFGVLASAGGYAPLARAFELRPLPSLGKASFAISLVAVPIAAFALRQSVPHLGPTGATVGAAALALFGGLIFGQLVDRYFEGPDPRRSLAERLGSPLGRVFSLARPDRAGAAAPAGAPEAPGKGSLQSIEEATLRPPDPVPLAVVSMHSGSPEDLEAEIFAAKRRLGERVALRELPAAASELPAAVIDAPVPPADAGRGLQVESAAIEMPDSQAAAIQHRVENAEEVDDMESGIEMAGVGSLAVRAPIRIRIGRSRKNGSHG